MNLLTKQKWTRRQKEFTVTFGEEQGVKHRLGSWGWHVHTTIFKIDSHQEPTVKSNNTF